MALQVFARIERSGLDIPECYVRVLNVQSDLREKTLTARVGFYKDKSARLLDETEQLTKASKVLEETKALMVSVKQALEAKTKQAESEPDNNDLQEEASRLFTQLQALTDEVIDRSLALSEIIGTSPIAEMTFSWTDTNIPLDGNLIEAVYDRLKSAELSEMSKAPITVNLREAKDS